jgi:guanylate kinase
MQSVGNALQPAAKRRRGAAPRAFSLAARGRMVAKLFCLLGKSGVGKDTLFEQIIQAPELDIAPVVPYTTRPRREDETDGIQYRFVSESFFAQLEQGGNILEKRQYSTVHGIWHYATVFDIASRGNFITITTPQGCKALAEKLGKDAMVIIYLQADDKTRLERAILRESGQKQPNYSEVCRRYLADQADFCNADFSGYTVFNIDTRSDPAQCFARFKDIFTHCIGADV